MPLNDSLYLTSLLSMQLIAMEPGSDETTRLLSPINLLGLSFIFILIQQRNLFSSMNSLIFNGLLYIMIPKILYKS